MGDSATGGGTGGGGDDGDSTGDIPAVDRQTSCTLNVTRMPIGDCRQGQGIVIHAKDKLEEQRS